MFFSATFLSQFAGLVYTGTRRVVYHENAIPFFSGLLIGKSKGNYIKNILIELTLDLPAATFNALSQGINVEWTLQDDTVNPFGDKRQALVTVYTFDLVNDILFFSDETRNLQLPLCCLREDRLVSPEDFTVFEPPSPPSREYLTFRSSPWTPTSPLPSRSLPFIARILSDFAHQWRHILRRHYADSTFRKLARAILCIAMLDFKVVEIASRWMHTVERGPFVWIHHLPFWKPCEEHIIRLEHITVVLDQDLEHALALIRKDVAENSEQKETATHAGPRLNDCFTLYLLLSVRHIALRRVNGQGILLCTPPAPFLNGVEPPSSAAIGLLLRGLLFKHHRPRTRLHELPVEIQDRILEHVSEGSIEAARLGSLLELGSPFCWTRPKDESRRGGDIERHESHTHRFENTPVESQIWFEVFSGVAYR